MSPQLARLVFIVGILGLFLLDRDKTTRVSHALWIPVIWLWIGGSRMVSTWLEMDALATPDQVLDGSPLDRNILLGLTALGVIVLIGRRQRVVAVMRQNWAVILFFAYCAISTLWSDYTFVAFKRWIKFSGDLVMVLVVLTDPDRIAAVKRLLARFGFVLVPMSILLIRYYSELGRGFDKLSGEPAVFGVAVGKNLLGLLCMISGAGAVWRLVLIFSGGKNVPRPLGPIIAQVALLAMVGWIFAQADSMTSMMCFALITSFIIATGIGALTFRPWIVHVGVALALSFTTIVLLGNVGGGLLKAVGRDPSLTGRTEIWSVSKEFAGSPVVGTGFESFWLGERLEKMWARYWWHPNEAHSGYLEVFLNLGWIGVLLFACVIARGYSSVIHGFRRDPATGSLWLGFFVAGLIFNVTETAVRAFHPLWFILLLTLVATPDIVEEASTSIAAAPEGSDRGALRPPPAFRLRPPGRGMHQPAAFGRRATQ